jgi:hypothetical protein
MMKIPSTLMSKLSLLIPLICLSVSAFAESPPAENPLCWRNLD